MQKQCSLQKWYKTGTMHKTFIVRSAPYPLQWNDIFGSELFAICWINHILLNDLLKAFQSHNIASKMKFRKNYFSSSFHIRKLVLFMTQFIVTQILRHMEPKSRDQQWVLGITPHSTHLTHWFIEPAKNITLLEDSSWNGLCMKHSLVETYWRSSKQLINFWGSAT